MDLCKQCPCVGATNHLISQAGWNRCNPYLSIYLSIVSFHEPQAVSLTVMPSQSLGPEMYEKSRF